jgi:CRISPR-associated protein Csh2
MSKVGRREVLFLYDVVYSNPNGDPNDENKPRLDEETNRLFVTDVRLKRTIRDYLKDVMGKEIYIYEEVDENGNRVSKTQRLERDFDNDPYEAMQRCIDLKLFGSTFALNKKDRSSSTSKSNKATKKNKEGNENEENNENENEADNEKKQKTENNLNVTGPVQFRFGRSLHEVKVQDVKGTTVMPTKNEKGGGAFTDKWIVPYALIAFEGIVNGIAADKEKIDLTADELEAMYTAMWYGTKELFTTSKAQSPMLLMEVVYNQEKYHIGDLERLLSIDTNEDINELDIRDTKDYVLDMTELVNVLKAHEDKIDTIRVKQNPLLRTAYSGEEKPVRNILEEQGFKVEDFPFEG